MLTGNNRDMILPDLIHRPFEVTSGDQKTYNNISV